MSKVRTSEERARSRLIWGMAASAALSVVVVMTSLMTTSRLGVPLYWPWLLTGLQVLALWSAGGDRWWGWLLGAAVQPVWVAYAVITGQLGFIPGCIVSTAVQTRSFIKKSPRQTPLNQLNGVSA